MVSDEALPPNLAVMTAAAVAVGHMMHAMPASKEIRNVNGIVGMKYSRAANARQQPVWIRMSHRCQRQGRSWRNGTLQKVRNNMTKIRVGIR